MFQKPEVLSYLKFINAMFRSSMNDWHYIPVYASCYFFILPFPNVFSKIIAVNILFVAIIYCTVSETIFKSSFCNSEHFLSGLLSADTTALYAMFVIKQLLLSWHSALFLQLHPWLLDVVQIILWLWKPMTEPIFLQQL